MVAVSKIIFIVVAVVVTIMVSVVIAASLGTQDDVYEEADPQPTHTPSETRDTVNGTPGTPAEPQDSASQTTVVVNGTSDTLTEPQDIASQTTEPPTQPAQPEEFGVVDTVVDKDTTKSNLPKVVDVGMLVLDLGTIKYHEEYTMAGLGMNDFNNYLEEIGAHWRMNLVFESIGFGLDNAMETTKSLDSNGVKFVLGPTSSVEIHHIKYYVDSNDMVLISSISSWPSLAVVDNIFRFSPDRSQQGSVLSQLFEQEGIEAVIPIYSGDIWGDSIYESVKNSFEALGDVMDEGIRYSPESTAYSAEASMLSDLVDKYTSQYPVDKIAVLMIGTSETVHLLGSAGSFDNLDSVRWFGTTDLSKNHILSDDPRASAFLQDVDFVSVTFSASRNDVYADVQERFTNYEGRTSSPYGFPVYDSVWVLGKTILETDSIDPLTVRDAITDVASRHTGATGTINLNEFGDFATPNYDLWSIRDGAWYKSGHFDVDSGTFSFT